MAKIPDLRNPDDNDKIIIILSEKYPILADNEFNGARGLSGFIKGKYSREAVEKIDPDTKLSFETYRRELEAMSPEELHELWLAALDRDIRMGVSSLPFNKPGTEARYDFWAKAAYWTVDEMAALSIGKDPQKVSKFDFSLYIARRSSLAKSYLEIRELIERAIKFKRLFNLTKPSNFIDWAVSLGIDLPKELVDLVAKNSEDVTNFKDLYQSALSLSETREKLIDNLNQKIEKLSTASQEFQSRAEKLEVAYIKLQEEIGKEVETPTSAETRSKDTLMKLVAAMAYQKYDWRPGKVPGPAKRIAGATEDVGARVSENTIRKYLNESLELIDLPIDK